jgi:CheY-like chemotaxis protein
MNDARDAALAAGVNDFVSKPVQMGRLQEAIAKSLKGEVSS